MYFLSKKGLVELRVLDKANAFDIAIILFIANRIEQNGEDCEAVFVDEDDETTTNALWFKLRKGANEDYDNNTNAVHK